MFWSPLHNFFYSAGGDDTICYHHIPCFAQRDFADTLKANPDYSGKKRIKPIYSRAAKDYNLGDKISKDFIERVKKQVVMKL